jgi:hypothetical protein
VHISGRERRLEAVGGGLIEAVEEVPVGVERGFDRGVSQPLLDDLRVLTLGDQERPIPPPLPLISAR